MQDKYILDYNQIQAAIIDAKNFGVSALLLINGEFYEIRPETIPNKEPKKDKDLPF